MVGGWDLGVEDLDFNCLGTGAKSDFQVKKEKKEIDFSFDI